MKFIGSLSCLIGLLFLFSCGEDESTLRNEIIIDGESFELINGYYFDIEGAESEAGRISHGTHYAQAFILTDGTLAEDQGELVCNDCTFQVFIDAASAGAVEFTSDDFNSEDPESTQLSSTAAESYLFLTAESSNGDAHFVSIANGTISIDVNAPIFKFDFDFSGRDESNNSEVKISGQFKATFEEMDPNLLAEDH